MQKRGKLLLQWGLIGSTTNRPTFCKYASLFAKCRAVLVVGSYQTPCTVTLLHLVSLLFAPPILHPTDHFLDREVFLFT